MVSTHTKPKQKSASFSGSVKWNAFWFVELIGHVYIAMAAVVDRLIKWQSINQFNLDKLRSARERAKSDCASGTYVHYGCGSLHKTCLSRSHADNNKKNRVAPEFIILVHSV